MKLYLKYFFITFLFFFTLQTFAQSISVNPTKVQTNTDGQFTITYTINDGGIDDFQAPSFQNFYIIGGPNRSQSMQIVNGSVSQSSTLSYVLQPKKIGRFTIASATVFSNKKTLRAPKIQVTVTQGAGTRSSRSHLPPTRNKTLKPQNNKRNLNRQFQPNNQNQPLQPASPPKPKKPVRLEDQVFVRILTDTTNVYQGQQITAIYRLYTSVDITDYGIKTSPSQTGFWVQDLTPKTRQMPGREVLDSVVYRVLDLKTYALFPQRPGKLTIDPMDLEVKVRIPRGNNPRSFFQSYRSKTLNLSSDTISINVYDLPKEGKPANFSGAVGNFKLSSLLSKRTVMMNESLDFSITVSGEGNIKLISEPSIVFPKNFDTFEPQISEDVYDAKNVVKGRKKFTYTIVPTKSGKQEIPVINYSYFDPELKKYKEISTGPFPIRVNEDDSIVQEDSDVDEGITDIYPLKNSTSLSSKGSYFFTSPAFWGLFSLPFLLFPLFVVGYRRREASLSDTVSLKRKRANKIAQKRLSVAKSHMKQNNKRDFYNEIIHAIWGYLGDKLHIPASDLSKENIRSVLTDNQVSESHIQKLLNTIEYCEMAIFAPVADADNLKGTYQATAELLADIEEETA